MSKNKKESRKATKAANAAKGVNGIRLCEPAKYAEKFGYYYPEDKSSPDGFDEVLDLAANWVNAWQQRDKGNRVALLLTLSDQGYSYEWFYNGRTMDDEFRAVMLMTSIFMADAEMQAWLNFTHDYIHENYDKFVKAFKESRDQSSQSEETAKPAGAPDNAPTMPRQTPVLPTVKD